MSLSAWRLLIFAGYGEPRMFSMRTKRKSEKRTLICALKTYGPIGGIQSFNRRVINALAKRAAGSAQCPPYVVILNDDIDRLPQNIPAEFLVRFTRLHFAVTTAVCAIFRSNLFIICHVNLIPLAAFVRVFRPKLPILLFVHGIEVWLQPGQRAKHWYESFCLRSLTKISSVSAYTARRMAEDFELPFEKFALLPNAVDPLADEPGRRKREPATILTVNRIDYPDRGKNADQMIRAVAQLRQSVPGLKYVIIGDGGLKSELEALAREMGVADIVEFRGWVGAAELRAAYGEATVFAMPSSKEGFGIVYLEAWQRGVPVICSKDGASSEIVSDGIDGFVVDPADIAMIAERLRDLLLRPELAKAMGENGRRKVEERYLDATFRGNLNALVDELEKSTQAHEWNAPAKSASPVVGPKAVRAKVE